MTKSRVVVFAILFAVLAWAPPEAPHVIHGLVTGMLDFAGDLGDAAGAGVAEAVHQNLENDAKPFPPED